MRIAGQRRVYVTDGSRSPDRVFEFTVERVTKSAGARVSSNYVNGANALYEQIKADDVTAKIRAGTASEAIQAFIDATGELERPIVYEYDYPRQQATLGHVKIRVTGEFKEVQPW